MNSVPKYGFGLEIEAVVEPWKIRPEWRNRPEEYYERLALALRNRELDAVADRLDSQYRAQHPEHYDKWFITKDGSLRAEENQVGLEAVSPILKTGTNEWEEELTLFWEAMRKVFKVQKNFTCGSHVHVAPLGRNYTLKELKIIAFAIITQEHLLDAFLPTQRRDNQYCKKNSSVSPQLKNFFSNGKSSTVFGAIANLINRMSNKAQICDLMQGTEQGGRYVIWNFQNIQSSGTIEFRGGRHLRGPNRSFWWITFAVSFISLALKQDLLNKNPAPIYIAPNFTTSGSSQNQVLGLWGSIKLEADRLRMTDLLPVNWQRMREAPGS